MDKAALWLGEFAVLYSCWQVDDHFLQAAS